MATVTVAATQMACTWDLAANLDRAEALVRAAAGRGAQIILLQELFATPYFCVTQDDRHFGLAAPLQGNPLIARFQALAAELSVVLPVSFFERAGNTRFNALVVLDTDGGIAAHYRKTHLPQNPGYEEKFYFSHGDTGFQVAQTHHGAIGCAICWDQWFPETARSLALMGAELIVFPTAIGSEPSDPALDSAGHWRRTMQGHAAANLVPVVASNRIGRETAGDTAITFYGTSFIADHTGAVVAEMDRTAEGVVTAEFDLDAVAKARALWGVFRDRRPEMYGPMGRLDAGRRT